MANTGHFNVEFDYEGLVKSSKNRRLLRDNLEERTEEELREEYDKQRQRIDGTYSSAAGKWIRGIADDLDIEAANAAGPAADLFLDAHSLRGSISQLRDARQRMRSAFIAWKVKELNLTYQQALVLWWEQEEEKIRNQKTETQEKIDAKGWVESTFISGSQGLEARIARLNSERLDNFGDIIRNLALLRSDSKTFLAALQILQKMRGGIRLEELERRFGSWWTTGPAQLTWQADDIDSAELDLMLTTKYLEPSEREKLEKYLKE